MLSDPVLRVADLLLFPPPTSERRSSREKQRRVILGVRLNYVVNRLNLKVRRPHAFSYPFWQEFHARLGGLCDK